MLSEIFSMAAYVASNNILVFFLSLFFKIYFLNFLFLIFL